MLSWPDGLGGQYILVKTLLDVYLLRSNFATLYQQAETATGTSIVGVYSDIMLWRGVLYVYPRRGLATLLILVGWQCEGLNVG